MHFGLIELYLLFKQIKIFKSSSQEYFESGKWEVYLIYGLHSKHLDTKIPKILIIKKKAIINLSFYNVLDLMLYA